ncbi:MAG: D-alanyl-D-alanine carboxypeptidase [Treponema sp.]|nr:D-alanyl-D-alanine carboxypeptidase [Treponema sp.]
MKKSCSIFCTYMAHSPLFVTIHSIATMIVCALALYLLCAAKSIVWPPEPRALSRSEMAQLDNLLNQRYPERLQLLSPLPYPTVPAELELYAKSAIIIDTATGSILFEKNADEPIPPASLTKLVEMYVVFEAVQNGEASLDDMVPLPPESWSVNLPGDASRMFLGKNEQTTLRELLLGLAIASGNDASIAVAHYISGTMEDFVARMNAVISSLELKNTHFVESSGYSELNTTTARDFAAFSRAYLNRFPDSLEQFHAQKKISYPLEHNLPETQKHLGDTKAVTQYNTNRLLGVLPGCDGLKTGYIDESGYNLALTAERYGTRFLSVTLRGPGNNSQEGNRYRLADGTTLMEFAFHSFADYRAPTGERAHRFTVGLAGAAEKSVKLVPALSEALTVPFIASDSPGGAAASVRVTAHIPSCIYGAVEQGTVYGTLTFSLAGTELRTIPLVAERTVPQANMFSQMAGKLLALCIEQARG